jgi:hypothetical protein
MCFKHKKSVSQGSLTGRLWLDDLLGVVGFVLLVWLMVKGRF